MTDYKIGDLVQVFDPFNPIVVGKKTKALAIVIDNVSRPGKDTVKIFWHGGYESWVPTHWIKKIDDDKEAK